MASASYTVSVPEAPPPGIHYAAVIYNRQILCSYSSGSVLYESTLEYILPQVDASRTGDKLVFNTHDGLAVHFLIAERGVLFTCISNATFPKQKAHVCLEALVKNFETANLFSRVVDAGPYGLTAQFGLALQVQMEKYSKPDALSSGQAVLNDLQAKVEEVKVVMVRNVQKIIDRGERLEDLNERAESLEMRSDQFRITSRGVRKKMWWQNKKMKFAIAGIVLVVLFIIIMSILGSTGVFSSSSSSSSSSSNPVTTTVSTTQRTVQQPTTTLRSLITTVGGTTRQIPQ